MSSASTIRQLERDRSLSVSNGGAGANAAASNINGVPPRSMKRRVFSKEGGDVNISNQPRADSKTANGAGSLLPSSSFSGILSINSFEKDSSIDDESSEAPLFNATNGRPHLHRNNSEEGIKLINTRRIRSNTVGWPSGGKTGSQLNIGSSPVSSSSNSNDVNDERSNAYFRRLSTLPEKKPNLRLKFRLAEVARKLLFAFSEIYSGLKRFNVIGNNDKIIQEQMSKMLVSAKKQINDLVEVLETAEDKDYTTRSRELVAKIIRKNITIFKDVTMFVTEKIDLFVEKADVCFIRMLLLSMFGTHNELYNAWSILNPTRLMTMKKSATKHPGNLPVSKDSKLVGARISVIDPKDEKLYSSSQSAVNSVQRVSRLITETLNKPGSQALITPRNQALVEDLIFTSSTVIDVSRKLNSTLASLTNSKFNSEEEYNTFMADQEKYKRIFLADIDKFISKVIKILEHCKRLMNDFPDLYALRGEMSLLSKTAKGLIEIFRFETGLPVSNPLQP